MIDNFVPLWSSVVDSTLWEEPPHVRLTFLTMLVMKGPDQVVRMPFRRLVKKVNLLVKDEDSQVREALGVLMAPDHKGGDSQPFDGRRIEEVVEEGVFVGWRVLNGEHYQKEMSRLIGRMRKTELQRQRRQTARGGGRVGGPLPGESAFAEAVERGDEAGADRILEERNEQLEERRRGRGKGSMGAKGKAKSKVEGVASGASAESASGGGVAAGPQAIGKGDNRPGVEVGGDGKAKAETEEAPMSLEDLAKMAAEKRKFEAGIRPEGFVPTDPPMPEL